jgi:hypothetical protein
MRAPAIARSAAAVSVSGIAPVIRKRTKASCGVESRAAATLA